MNPNQPVHNPIQAMRENEVEIFKIRRHPIGLIGVQLTCTILVIGIAVISYAVLPSVLSDMTHSKVMMLATLITLIAAAIVIGFLAIATKVYWGNAWVLTSDSLTQMVQTTLFNNQSSQLSLENLEDVTAEKNGILAHMFNFGLLKCETAGEHSKFSFPYCPNPEYYAQKIIEAREEFMQGERVPQIPAPAAPMPQQQMAQPDQPSVQQPPQSQV